MGESECTIYSMIYIERTYTSKYISIYISIYPCIESDGLLVRSQSYGTESVVTRKIPQRSMGGN